MVGENLQCTSIPTDLDHTGIVANSVTLDRRGQRAYGTDMATGLRLQKGWY